MRLKFHTPLPRLLPPPTTVNRNFEQQKKLRKKSGKSFSRFSSCRIVFGDRRSRRWLDEVVDSIADIVQKLNIFAACSL